jgi:uncharacterized membrane protein YidH (DUF202 family)
MNARDFDGDEGDEFDIEGAVDRGALAWQRTALGLAAIGSVLLYRFEPFERARPLIGFAILALALAMVLIGYAYRRRRHGEQADHSVLLAVTIATMLAGVVAFVIGVFVP